MNAVKYSAERTTIHICVNCLVNHVLIQVEDEGIGIPEGEQHEIFKRFYRGSNAKDIVKEGAGGGLYLARSIIEKQGGTIAAKRKNGKGTTFQITLPLSDFKLEVMTLLKKCVKDFHQTLVMITHDETIAQMADVVVVIEDGKVVRKS